MSDMDDVAVVDDSGGEDAWQYADGDGQSGAESDQYSYGTVAETGDDPWGSTGSDSYGSVTGEATGEDPWGSTEADPYASRTDEGGQTEQGDDLAEVAFFEALEDLVGEGVLSLADEEEIEADEDGEDFADDDEEEFA